MKKILVCLPNLDKANGIASFFMNYLKSLNEFCELDFFLLEKIYDKEYYELIMRQGKIYFASSHNKLNKIKVISKDIKKIVEQNSYDYVHINLVNIYAFSCFKGLKACNFQNIIYHAHNPLNRGNIYFLCDILNYYMINHSKKLIACTKEAGKSVFKKKEFQVIHNAIYAKDYIFDREFRLEFRKKYNLNEEFIMGNIARIEDQKNPIFVLKILKKLYKENKMFKFFFIGSGSLELKIRKYIKKYNLEKNVFVLGKKENANKYYSVLDLFLLPSKYEGLGIVFIEAQVSNLPILTSNRVPSDIKLTELVSNMKLTLNKKNWIQEINKFMNLKNERKDNIEILKENGYDVTENSELIKFYKEIMEE